MRLIWIELKGYRRFETRSRMNVDGKLVAIVGPNESGKSSFLRAMQRLNDSEPFALSGANQELTREAQIPADQTIVKALFLLEQEDSDAVSHLPGGKDIRWCELGKRASGKSMWLKLTPSPSRPLGLRHETVMLLKWTIEQPTLASFLQAQEDNATDGELSTAVQVKDLIEALEAADEDLPAKTQEAVVHLAKLLATLADQIEIDDFRELSGMLLKLAQEEAKKNPETEARAIIFNRRPQFLFFSQEARALAAEYDLKSIDGEVPLALKNLAMLASLDLQLVRELVEQQDHGGLETLQERANERLRQVVSESWSQSRVVVRIRIDGAQLRVLVGGNGAPFVTIAERSDGPRQFVALLSFLALEARSTVPILLIDELETHLHYDAQVDLVQMLARQELARQVIYTTHSLGCLPEDLGSGVRLIEPDSEARSSIRDSFWERGGKGFSPLLFGMGARAMSFIPIRYALLTEGATEMLLLPSLLREATGRDFLGFQVVPGLANASVDEVALLEHGAPRSAWLVDSDPAGDEIAKKLRRARIAEHRIFSLPKRNEAALVIEDLLSADIYLAAIREELRRSVGPEPVFPADALPVTGRPRAVEEWCNKLGFSPPNKKAIAYRILEMRQEGSILSEDYRVELKNLYELIRRALSLDSISQ